MERNTNACVDNPAAFKVHSIIAWLSLFHRNPGQGKVIRGKLFSFPFLDRMEECCTFSIVLINKRRKSFRVIQRTHASARNETHGAPVAFHLQNESKAKQSVFSIKFSVLNRSVLGKYPLLILSHRINHFEGRSETVNYFLFAGAVNRKRAWIYHPIETCLRLRWREGANEWED